jgi:hypothetical protein
MRTELRGNLLIWVLNNFLFDLDLVNDLLFLQRFQEIFCSSTFGSFFLFIFCLLGELGFLFFFGLSLPLEHVIPIVGDVADRQKLENFCNKFTQDQVAQLIVKFKDLRKSLFTFKA